MSGAIRVLVVDDQAYMRALIGTYLEQDGTVKVVGEASNAQEARKAIKMLDPDVITLDVEMPGMDGISFLEKIMRLRPKPVIMVSSMTQRGAAVTIQALEIGAVDCVVKPTPDNPDSLADLPRLVRRASKANIRPTMPHGCRPPVRLADSRRDVPDLIAIGSSTGGVEALIEILSRFPESCPPTLIVQHIPPTFTASLAARLDRAGQARVQVAADGMPLEAGNVYLAPGREHHLEVAGRRALHCKLVTSALVSGHRPSADVLFRSVAARNDKRSVGVLLTGMGRDGAEGLLEMHRAGALTIGQDQATCVVFGMPRAAAELGAVDRLAPIERIADEIFSAQP